MATPVRICRPDLPGIEILHVSGAAGTIPAHVHWSWCVVGVERGERVFSTGRAELVLWPGEAAVIPPGLAHGCVSPEGGCDFWVLGVESSRVACSSSNEAARIGLRRVDHPEPFRRLAFEPIEADTDLISGLMAVHAADDCAAGPPATGQSPPVRAARGLLEGPREKDLSLDDLARLSGASPAHLARRFTRETGLPPHEYRTLVRLRQARALLAAGSSLAAAAAACGFYDQSHLTLRFRKYMGMTPGQYARAAR